MFVSIYGIEPIWLIEISTKFDNQRYGGNGLPVKLY